MTYYAVRIITISVWEWALMSEIMTSRFFTRDDPQLNKPLLKLPEIWWSRPYEYAWASSFISRDHVVLDAGCGICHPFKYYLCTLCENVYACDKDERLLSKVHILREMISVFGEQALDLPLLYLSLPYVSRQDISATTYDAAMFDHVICISVLEHLVAGEILKTLVEFRRIIKPDGLILITIDYPYLSLDLFDQMVKESGLSYAGPVSFALPVDALTTALFPEFPEGIFSFRAILKK